MRVLLLKVIYPLLALSSFINPYYGVLNYAFISVIRPESLTWGGAAVQSVSFMAIGCLLLASIIKGFIRGSALMSKFFFFFLLFYLCLFFVTYQSPVTYISPEHETMSFSFVKQILIIYAYCLCMYCVINHDLKLVLIYVNALMLMFLFMGIWGIQQRFHGNMLVEGLFGEAIKDRCAITGIFVLVFPLGLYNFNYPYAGKKIWKYLGLLSSITSVLMVFFTDSRAGFLGFVFCIGILCISMKNKIRNIIILCVSLAVLFPMLPDSYQERIFSINKAKKGASEADVSAGARMVMWEAAIIIFTENTLFGVGNLNFAEVAYDKRMLFVNKISKELFDYAFQENFKLQCHNMYLDIFAEGGLATAIPFYCIMIIPLFRAVRLRNLGNDPENLEIYPVNRLLFYLLAGMMGYLLTCFFANMRFIDYYYWMLTLILIVGELLELKYKAADEAKTNNKGMINAS